jgi:BMFP domain-containing protein YqiC
MAPPRAGGGQSVRLRTLIAGGGTLSRAADGARFQFRRGAYRDKTGVVRRYLDKEERVMQTNNPLLDDLARMASGAVGALTGMRAEVEARVRDQLERILARMDLVTREEFDAVRAMAAKARIEQERLEARLAELEARLESLATQPARPVRRAAASPAG